MPSIMSTTTSTFVAPVSFTTKSTSQSPRNSVTSGRRRLFSPCTTFRLSSKNASRYHQLRCCVESGNTGANPSFSETGEALVRAAMLGDTEEATRLISSTADLDVNYASELSPARMTALMWAAVEGHLEIAQSLISAGAKDFINQRNAKGYSPLLFAMETMPNTNPFPSPPPGFPGAPSLMKQRKENGDDVPKQQERRTIISGHVDVINLLIENGADVSIRTESRESMLHLATRRGQEGLVRKLLVKGLQLDDNTNYAQETPLHIAAKQAHLSIVRLLLALGADINAKNVFGWTPLIWAAASGWEDVVVTLLENNPDVNVKAKNGDDETTALKEARKSSKPESISKLLIRAGAIE